MIAWSSSRGDYAKNLVEVLETQLEFKFDYSLSLADQSSSEEKDFFFKNIEILIDKGGRSNQDVLIIDTQMANYTNRLTNGIFVPLYRLHEDPDDAVLTTLLKYLGDFILADPAVEDFRTKVKEDFKLLEKFNSFKQT